MGTPNDTASPELCPFQNIAVAFSGGGFRAAAFALGTLSYLERLSVDGAPATKKISYIASASGGTITNLLYAAAIHKGEIFMDFYQHAKKKMAGEGLLEKALALVNDDSAWGKGDEKRQNMINAFARIYDRELFGGETMAVFSEKKHTRKFEICCNATEFYRGLSFRFQTNGTRSRDQLIGNRYLSFDVTHLETFQKIKLGDILAASSCFPMGFEPIVFPEDFTYSDPDGKSLNSTELRHAVCYEDYNERKRHLGEDSSAMNDKGAVQGASLRSFGLMDGGITDNQALNSLMLADKKRRRSRKPNPFDLMIITDVGSYFMDRYEVPPTKAPLGWRARSVSGITTSARKVLRLPKLARNIGLLVSAACFGTAVYVTPVWLRYALLIIGGMALSIGTLAFVLLALPSVRGLLRKPWEFDPIRALRRQLPLDSFSDRIISKLLNYLKLTKLNVLEQMLKARISSAMTMVADVNLKQVRRLIYQAFYNDKCWDNRRVPNFIYELSAHNAVSRSNRLNDPKRLSWTATAEDKELLNTGLERLHAIAQKARTMGTTLWFDKQDMEEGQPANIIMTGQFTTCMNLLEYVISLERKRVALTREQREVLQHLKGQLIRDIQSFKLEPGFMYL